MTRSTAPHFRRTALCLATAIAVSLPGIAAAGILDKAKTRAQSAKAKATTVVSIVRERQPLATALQNARENLPGTDLFEMVQELELLDQLRDTIALLRQMQADYGYFSGGGSGCQAKCAAFRTEFKAVFADFLTLVDDVPALRAKTGLIENIQRVSALIDYVPPRALYLMWQAMDGQMEELRMAAEEIRQVLAILPPLEADPGIAADANTAGIRTTASGAGASNRPVCDWVDADKPFVELLQARLEMFAWRLKTAAELIPDVEVKAEAGAEAGAAVANVTGAAGAGVKPTDLLKIGLNALAFIPERINWAIKINTLRAKVVCA